tara:strand:- start:412 stop:666 length:255 start_codon:yes stop_codon:yes gene_type:complete
MFYLYYLLYQIKNDTTLWIVNVDENYYNLKNIITNINNNYEDYYLIERQFEEDLKIIDNELQRNHFVIFDKKKTDKTLYSTLKF